MFKNKIISKRSEFKVKNDLKLYILILLLIGIISGCARKTPERLLEEAEQAIYQGDIVTAIIRLEDFLERFPNDPRAIFAQYQIGLSYEMKGNFNRAIQEYQVVLDEYPVTHELHIGAQFAIANSYAAMTVWDKAQDIWKTLAKDTANPLVVASAKMSLAKSYELLGDYATAEKGYQELLNLFPLGGEIPKQISDQREINILENLAEVYIKQNKYQQAISTFQIIQSDFPEDEYARDLSIWLNVRIGEIYNQMNQNRRAREYYDKAIAGYAQITADFLIPDRAAWALSRMGEIYEQYIHDTTRAIEIYEEAVKNHPTTRSVVFAQRNLMRLSQATAIPPQTE